MFADVPVVILCGGRGARLNERTEEVPKPMVEVGGRPILWHVMKIFAARGFRRFVLCLGYKGERIREYFAGGDEWRRRDCTVSTGDAGRVIEYHEEGAEDWDVTLANTGASAETGERLLRVQQYVEGAPAFFLTYADGVSDVSVGSILDAHRASGRLATMTCVRPRTHYGLVDVAEGGLVAAYREKPNLGAVVNGGFFALGQGIFDYVLKGEAFEREPLQRLIQIGALGAYAHDGFWACMDTYKDCQELNDMWARGQALWKVW